MKFKQNYILILLLIFVSGLLSCTDEKNPLVSDNSFTIDKFPHAIGTVWKYQRINNKDNRFDTLFVRISDTVRDFNSSLLLYEIQYKRLPKSFSDNDIHYRHKEYWHFSGDTLSIYRRASGVNDSAMENKIIFPLEVETSWATYKDSIEVIENNRLSILDNNYQNAFQIKRTRNDSTQLFDDSYWYTPNIGIIQMNENHNYSGYIYNHTWNLIAMYKPDSFQFNQFPTQVGASWNYLVNDNVEGCGNGDECFDEAEVSITANHYVGDYWRVDYPELVNSASGGYSYFSEAWRYTANIYNLNWGDDGLIPIKFPCSIGDSWKVKEASYIYVVDSETITTESGTYPEAYKIKGLIYYNNDYNYSHFEFTIWIVKNIGIVKIISHNHKSYRIEDKTWELESYDPD